MIMVASSSKPFTYTAKNTARRQAIIADYEPEIEALYAAVDETTQADITPPSSWDLQSSLRFVREVVRRVLTHEVNDSDDIFQKGCDRFATRDLALCSDTDTLVIAQLASDLDPKFTSTRPPRYDQCEHKVFLK